MKTNQYNIVPSQVIVMFIAVLVFASGRLNAGGWPQSCILSSTQDMQLNVNSLEYLFTAEGACFLLRSEQRVRLDASSPVFITRDPIKSLGSYKFVQNPDDIYRGQVVFGSGTSFDVKFRGELGSGPLIWNYPYVNHIQSSVWSGDAYSTLQNSSTRAWIAPGKPAILGHIYSRNVAGYYLIRAVSTSLASFGVKKTCSSIKLTLSWQTDRGVETESGASWCETSDAREAFTALFSLAGAFPLLPNSNEPVIFTTFRRRFEVDQPGVYTVSAETSEGEGEVLVEIYSLPFEYAQ